MTNSYDDGPHRSFYPLAFYRDLRLRGYDRAEARALTADWVRKRNAADGLNRRRWAYDAAARARASG